ncbi:MAG: bifunctional phosphoribosylaminoimidazolecarboxamide formyltransferase/IMP cyclohydrolase, partial [Kamptonema sp. SIO4C4]|nr:bifunctional phosphoribosylaminoimidazolecarboxamide formyltransferase/IMP cyclohydrolase [Kamptonema sp. SIO4C4]
AKALQEAGIPVTKVSDYTGSPEILAGRVKTLHPRIHGGILARADVPEDMQELSENEIQKVDLVVVNLYPFEQTIAKRDVTTAEAIENIDIGGPTLLRAAAKNHAHLTVLCNPLRYEDYLTELRENNGGTSLDFRQARAYEGFSMTAAYDSAISAYFAELTQNTGDLNIAGSPMRKLRYGENPHQEATWYKLGDEGWTTAEQLQGKELSYNNLVDLEAARRIIKEFTEEPAAAVLKHTNPCGVSVASSLSAAYQQAFDGDSVSAFGGIVALNRPIDAPTAEAMTKTFLECVVAPGCEEEAKAILAKKSKLRVLILPNFNEGALTSVKTIAGGMLVQDADDYLDDPKQWQVATEKKPTDEELGEMIFAWKVAKHVKSNAIVITRDRATLGIGAGQMNRVGAANIALEAAGEGTQGACLASDGFFPFDDTVRAAAHAGIKMIVQPGGSIRDKDSIAAANELGIIMVLTGTRHFLH